MYIPENLDEKEICEIKRLVSAGDVDGVLRFVDTLVDEITSDADEYDRPEPMRQYWADLD